MTDEDRAAKKEAFQNMSQEEKRDLITGRKEQAEAKKNALLERLENNDNISEERATAIKDRISNF